MNLLSSSETELVGEWVFENNNMRGDQICERIEWLIDNVLKKVGYSKEAGAWETLYRDPNDGRYWVKVYPKGHMHGGGPPALKFVLEDTVRTEYIFEI